MNCLETDAYDFVSFLRAWRGVIPPRQLYPSGAEHLAPDEAPQPERLHSRHFGTIDDLDWQTILR